MTNVQPLLWQNVTYSLENSKIPIPRWGHKLIQVSQNKILMFGGFGGEDSQGKYLNDLWQFDLITFEWNQFHTTGNLPENRSNYTIHYNSKDDQVILFGGGSSNKMRFNTICILNLRTKQWMKINPNTSEQAPWQRTYHSGQFLYPYLFVHGGQGVSNIDMNDLWIFNIITKQWKKLQFLHTSEMPSQRRFHTTAIIDGYLYIIGGCKENYTILGDIYRVNLQKLYSQQKYDDFIWECLQNKNIALQRWGHSSDVYNGKIYIYGGRINSSTDTSDILMFDPSKNIVQKLNIKQKSIPKARRRHATVFIGNSLLSFGGYNGHYLNDFNYLTFARQQKIISKYNLIYINSIDQIQNKLNYYQNKIDINEIIIIQKQNNIINIKTNKQKILQNIFFNYIKKYSINSSIYLSLPSFCSINIFKNIHLAIIQGDILLCKKYSYQYYINFIKSAQYLNCIELIPIIQSFLINQINPDNCIEVLQFAILAQLQSLKYFAAEVCLRNQKHPSNIKINNRLGGTQDFIIKSEDLQKCEMIDAQIALDEVYKMIKFDIGQIKLKNKIPNILSRTVKIIKNIFMKVQQQPLIIIKSEINNKKQEIKQKKGCLQSLLNFMGNFTLFHTE